MNTEYFIRLAETLRQVNWHTLTVAVETLQEVPPTGNIWLCGNGGSAATASHFANDLWKMAHRRAFALPDANPLTLAFGNDTGYINMFRGPLVDALQERDVLVAFSCSGKSPNVLRAAKFVMNHGGKLIVLTGNRRSNPLGRLDPASTFFIESDDIRIQEDCHLAICHALAGELANPDSRFR